MTGAALTTPSSQPTPSTTSTIAPLTNEDFEEFRVSPDSEAGVTPVGRRANSAISRPVTFGASSPSPAATTRTAWISSSAGASLSRKPLAPARSAS